MNIRRLLENQPVLYACENDHLSVAELAQKLEGFCIVVPCLVDRICSSVSLTADENNCVVSDSLHNPPRNFYYRTFTPIGLYEGSLFYLPVICIYFVENICA